MQNNVAGQIMIKLTEKQQGGFIIMKTIINTLEELIELAGNYRDEVPAPSKKYVHISVRITRALTILNELKASEKLQDIKSNRIVEGKFGDGRLVQEIEREAILKEREACAKLCEELDSYDEFDPGQSCADIIRAR